MFLVGDKLNKKEVQSFQTKQATQNVMDFNM